MSVAVANASGSPTDWVGLFDVATNQTISWKYLNGTTTAPAQGVTSASLSWTMPVAFATYEFRLLANGSSTTVLTTGPRVQVELSPTVNEVPRPNTAYVAVGEGASIVVQGNGHVQDWIGRYVPAAPDTPYADWAYLNNSQTAPSQPISGAATVGLPLPAAGTYEFRYFAANGYGRLGTSSPVVATCVTGVTPGAASVAASAGTLTLTVAAPSSCAWTATSGHSAATITAGASGTGNGVVTLALAAHTGTAARTVPVTVGGREVLITQQKPGVAALCATVTPTALSLGAAGGTTGVTVAADGACEWTSASESPFLFVTRGLAGNGSRGVTVVVKPNLTESARTGTVIVGGTPVTITQDALPKTGQPQLSLAPGTYYWTQYVNVNAPTGAIVRYTTTGVTPTTADPEWPGSLVIDRTITLAVRAWQTGLLPSDPVVAGYELQALPPGVSPPTGTYAPPVTVSMSPATGTTVRYTLDGTTPTETSPVYGGGTFTLAASTTVTARGFRAGWSPSSTVTNVFTIAVPPTLTSLSPSSGPVGTVVTLTGANFGATQGASTVSFNGTVATATAWSTSSITVTVPAGATTGNVTVTVLSQASSGSAFSVTPSPVLTSLSPATGSVGTVVTLTGSNFGVFPPDSGVTFNGVPASPTVWSGTSITIPVPRNATTGSVVVRVGGVLSNGLTFTVTDTVGPTITTLYTPERNAAGWNRTPVTVSFTCTDDHAVVSCPGPLVFDQVGAGQQVTVTASDNFGNQSALLVTANVDTQPAAIDMTAPTDGFVTSTPAVTVTAQVSDVLSGVALATCNGAQATVAAGAVSCAVPLQPGTNSVVLAVLDVAGNSVSKGLRVMRSGTPAAITVTPSTKTMAVGDIFHFSVVSEFGPASPVAWVSSNPSVLMVATDGSEVVTAMAAGMATLTATVGALTAQADVTVLTGGLAPGAVPWRGPAPSPGTYKSWMLPSHRVDDAGPDLFTVEAASETGPYTMRGLSADGRVLSTEGSALRPIFGDQYGGLVVESEPRTSLSRIATGAGQAPWTYAVPAGPYPGMPLLESGPAQGPDGTVYVVEKRYTTPISGNPGAGYNSEADLVGINGQTGAALFRVPLPQSTRSVSQGECAASTLIAGHNSRSWSEFSPIVIGQDGAAYLEVGVSRSTWAPACTDVPEVWENNDVHYRNTWLPGQGLQTAASELHLVRVTSAGAMTSTRNWLAGSACTARETLA